MSDARLIAETAFRLHAEEILSREELVHILQQCVNSVAIENGYANVHGLPFTEHARARRVRRVRGRPAGRRAQEDA